MPWTIPWILRGSTRWVVPRGSNLKLGTKWLWDFLTYDGYKDAKNVTAPTLIVSAGHDGTVAKPYEHRIFARRFSNAKQITIPKAGHNFRKHENQVAGTITEWLTSS